MIVFCTNLVLHDPPEKVLGIACDWINHKLRSKRFSERIEVADLPTTTPATGICWSLKRDVRIYYEAFREQNVDQTEYRSFLAYSHRDHETRDRRWVTEISLRGRDTDSEIEVSILLATQDYSILAQEARLEFSRPYLTKQILDRCQLSTRTVGASPKELSDTSLEAYSQLAKSSSRTYPILVLSANNQTGQYHVDPAWLHSHTVGIADIAIIPPSVDVSRLIERFGDLGHLLLPWDGAVTVLYPPLPRREGARLPFIPTQRFRPSELDQLRTTPSDLSTPSKHVAGTLVARLNKSLSQEHLSLSKLRDFRLRSRIRSLTARASEATGLGKEEKEAYESLLAEAEEALDSQEERVSKLRQELDRRNADLEILQHHLNRKESSANPEQLTEEHQQSIIAMLSEKATPLQMLQGLAVFFSTRIVVLPSALRSAKASSALENKYARKLQDLLVLLATQYYDRRKDGHPEPAQVFPSNSFASNDTYNGKPLIGRPREIRTFQYNGQQVYMPAHLKVGIGEGVGRCARVHFFWDDVENAMVVGYCGRHLDTH